MRNFCKVLGIITVVATIFLAVSNRASAATEITSYEIVSASPTLDMSISFPSLTSNVSYAFHSGVYPTASYVSGSTNTSCDIFEDGICTLVNRGFNGSLTNAYVAICAYTDNCSLEPQMIYYAQYRLGSTDIPGSGLITNETTRIVEIFSPSNFEATSTSVTFSFSYYAATSDFNFSSFSIPPKVNLLITNSENINDSIVLSEEISTFDLTVPSSSTVVLQNNSRYTWFVSISGEKVGTGNFVNNFTPGMPNFLAFYQFTTGSFDPTNGLTYDLSSCNVLSGFDAESCLYNLLVPTPATLSSDIAKFKAIPPWGYAFRFYDIVSTSSLVALPSVVMPIPGSGTSLDLTPWFFLFGSSSPLTQASANMSLNGVNYGDGRSLREITETYWNYLWTFILGIAIVAKLLGIKSSGQTINEQGGVGDRPYGPNKP